MKLNVNELEHQELVSSKTGEVFSRSLVLTDFLQCPNLFVHHEILAPGRKASSPHRHTEREELIYILEGHPTEHVGDQVAELKPGDFMGFSPGSQELHFIENQTDKEVRLLVICSNPKTDQTVFTPHHPICSPDAL